MAADEGSKSRVTQEILVKTICNEFGVEPSQVEVGDKFETSYGSNAGDNFACEIRKIDIKAKVKGEEKQLSYISKEVPMNEMREKYFRMSPMFQKEIFFYSTIGPAMASIRKKIGVPETKIPAAYYHSDEEGVIIMHNVKSDGFKLMPKTVEGLPKEYVEMALKELAVFAATSYHFLQTYPGGEDQLKKDQPSLACHAFMEIMFFGNKDPAMMEPFLQFFNSIIGMASTILKKKANEPELAKRVDDLLPCWLDKMKAAEVPTSGFKTVIHGDAWYNNIMFRHNVDGSVKDLIILDLQIQRITTPVVDLLYFLTSSTSPELRTKHLDEWLELYHSTLMKELALFGYDKGVYPVENFQKDVANGWPSAFLTGMLHAQVLQINERQDESGMTEENVTEEMEKMADELMEKALKNEALCSRVIGLCKEALVNNVFGK